MRFQRLQTALRAFTTASRSVSVIRRRQTVLNTFSSFGRIPLPLSGATVLKAAPAIPFLGSLFSSSAKAEGQNNGGEMSHPVQKSEEEWRAQLSPEQFRILRQKGTEPSFTGEYDSHYPSQGVYTCAGCEAPLYKASHKFKSGCGWPAFFDAIPGAITRHTDSSFGMQRTEIVCSNCGGHLGHVFKGEGYSTPTDERHCVNSISLKFADDDKAEQAKAKA
ncbi:hypothetical protein Plec18170_001782 [Paecilomyces lecythidis]